MRYEVEDGCPLAAFTRLSRRVARLGVLRPGLITYRIPEPVLTGLSSEALAVLLKLLMKSALEAR